MLEHEPYLPIIIDTKRLAYILKNARHECQSACGFGRYCPHYWRRVFRRYFGGAPEGIDKDPKKDPSGDTDPRWSRLLESALPIQAELLGYVTTPKIEHLRAAE
jgi:hypothetical protein